MNHSAEYEKKKNYPTTDQTAEKELADKEDTLEVEHKALALAEKKLATNQQYFECQ